jgi:hypothetical protein
VSAPEAARAPRPPWRTSARQAAGPLAFVAVVAAYYVFLVSAGQWSYWPTWTAYYEEQVQGFLQGHLYLPISFPPGLKALTDPLNPANMRFWRWDRSYYHGHFYLYWGLVPAVLTTIVKVIFRIRRAVTDDVIVFAFSLVRLAAGTLLIRHLAARMIRRPTTWAVALALVVFAVGHPTPYLLNRGGIYEASITGGACFMVAGLYLGLRGVFAIGRREADLWLLAASLSLGAAGGSRTSLLPTVALLIAFTILVRWRIDRGSAHSRVVTALFAGAPAAVLTLAHFVLNRLRYDAWTEFGASYQMGYPAFKVGKRFLLPDLYTYLLGRFEVSCLFPFFSSKWDSSRRLAPAWLFWPADHHTSEPTVGVLRAVPFLWLILVAALAAAFRRWRRGRGEASPAAAPDLSWRWRWVRGALWIYALASAAPLVLLSATTMRYEADVASSLLLLATLAGWDLLAIPERRGSRAAASLAYAILAIATIVLGILLGVGGYFDHFGRHNHALLTRLQHAFSVCAAH